MGKLSIFIIILLVASMVVECAIILGLIYI
jgi:hypothetical protein